MASAREALRRLQAGKLVAVFPEGGINLGKGLREASPGIAWLALRAKVPVYPVFIHGSPQGTDMVEPFLGTARVRVIYGDPIDLSGYEGQRKSHELLAEVTDLLMRRLAELGGVSYGKGDSPENGETLPFEQATG
jgi:1-acyl-sn-glycerol-3-phosphate acyltransferase